MKKYFFLLSFTFLLPLHAKADLFGGDLPLLAEIVTNTLNTIIELEKQTTLMNDEMAGIRDRIDRIRTISDLVQPSTWDQWKDPKEALDRLRTIYYTLPKEYRSDKSDLIEGELDKAMNMIGRLDSETKTTFYSGKELERRGADASPGVAQKLTASGVGTLISLESQTQAIDSHIVSLLAQTLALANEKESRLIVSKGKEFNSYSENLGSEKGWFSVHVYPIRMSQ